MVSLTDYGYSGMDNGIKIYHFLQGIKSTELVAAVNVKPKVVAFAGKIGCKKYSKVVWDSMSREQHCWSGNCMNNKVSSSS